MRRTTVISATASSSRGRSSRGLRRAHDLKNPPSASLRDTPVGELLITHPFSPWNTPRVLPIIQMTYRGRGGFVRVPESEKQSSIPFRLPERLPAALVYWLRG